ncbi:M15 family metallopeptidase [Streptomyces sp. AC512_CC834]|uniref:M15 family metallopeptidase n=1 Tax=Streptomyces sp. AC512_CC834 TaxID=2823691 RepID=UPI001C2806EE|nr:M15 family metallopeptidase [Streptomyces sp. AC512_CC834]
MTEIVLMSDPKIAAIPVKDCDEPLLDVRRHDPFPVDTREQDDSGAFAHLRQGVLSRLVDARKLLPDGIRLLFIEGYRPPALQRFYFERYAESLRSDNPGWSSEQVRAAASRFVSPPQIAPHSAGAAVDLTLVAADGKELDMGTPVDASPEVSEGACYTAARNIGSEARGNRQILTEALTGVGLVNYPTEWWHWSYGDRYWALATGTGHAVYGPRELG